MKAPDPALVFCLACIAWGLILALLVGACGGAQRPCYEAVNRTADQPGKCREGR